MYTVIVKNCTNWSYYDAWQIFLLFFLKIFYLVSLLWEKFTYFLKKKPKKQTTPKIDDVTVEMQEWKNRMVLRLNVYTLKSIENTANSSCKFLSLGSFWTLFLCPVEVRTIVCVCGMEEVWTTDSACRIELGSWLSSDIF